MEQPIEESQKEPQERVTHVCLNGEESTEFAWWTKDGRGIPLCKVCDRCEKEKLKRYRPEVLGYYDESDVDEDIEPDGDW